MPAPANEYQAAVYAALIADSAVSALVADRIYDRVPMDGDIAPYITLGEGEEIPDGTDCKEIADHTLTINVWSESQGGFKEAKEIAFAVKKALHNRPIDLPTHGMIDQQLVFSRPLRDPDGITSRVTMSFQSMIEEN